MKLDLSKYKLAIIICFICVILEILMDLLLPFILSDTINIGIGNKDISYIINNIIFMFIILVIGIFGSIFSTYLSSKISTSISYDIRYKLVNKILNLKYKDIDKINIGNTITLITNDTDNIENIIFLILKILIKIPIVITGSIFMCLTLNKDLSLILLIIVPIIIIISYIFMKKTYPYFNYTTEVLDDINSYTKENINNIKLIKSESNEKYEINRFNKLNLDMKNINIKALKIFSLMMPIIIFIINITTILILLISNKINTNIGNVTAFIEYINLLLSSIVSTSMILLLLVQSNISIKRIKKILNLDNEVRCEGLKNKIKGNIKFENVYFKYDNTYILENINLDIKQGSKVAIIGVTGSGKSTLVNLLNRNYEIDKGSILIDDINIKEYDYNYLKEKIMIINQKSSLFKGNIISNLKLNKKINIDKYLNITLSNKIINKKGKNFIIEESGKNLSGGEKQRLVLARGLIKEPDILVLDDSMSATDLSIEKDIINNLINNYKDTTIIFITSRIGVVKDFDKIILLEDGKIKKVGNHNTLMKDKTYKDLYELGGVL